MRVAASGRLIAPVSIWLMWALGTPEWRSAWRRVHPRCFRAAASIALSVAGSRVRSGSSARDIGYLRDIAGYEISPLDRLGRETFQVVCGVERPRSDTGGDAEMAEPCATQNLVTGDAGGFRCWAVSLHVGEDLLRDRFGQDRGGSLQGDPGEVLGYT